MRKSRRSEILFAVANRPEGYTWDELIFSFPRKTLDRHLKALIELGYVEKIVEPRCNCRRGRQSTRYRVPSKYWHNGRCLCWEIFVKKDGLKWFVAIPIHRLGTTHLRKTDLGFSGEKLKVVKRKK